MLLALEFATKAKSSSGSYTFLLVIIAAYAVAYFVFLRPRNKRNRTQREQARNVEVGDKAVTIGGLVGVVTKIDNGLITLRTESGAELEFITKAIAQRYVEPSSVVEPEADNENEGDAH